MNIQGAQNTHRLETMLASLESSQGSPSSTSQAGGPADAMDSTTKQFFLQGVSAFQSLGLDITGATNQAFVSGLSAGHRQEIAGFGRSMSALVGGKAGGAEDLAQRFGDYTARLASGGEQVDVNALVQAVLRQSYVESTQDLYLYAQKVKFFNNVKGDIRNELNRAREELVNYANQEETAPLSTAYETRVPGQEFIGEAENASPEIGQATTKGELIAHIEKLEETLSSVGDDAQLANVDLQNILQKQQQTIQMMSNISKQLHDTALSIIRKIGG